MEFFVPSHSSRIVTGFWAKHEMKNIAQQPYSPRLAPCDCFLFSKLKNPLRRTRVDSIEVIQNLSLPRLTIRKQILKAILTICIKICGHVFLSVRVKFRQLVYHFGSKDFVSTRREVFLFKENNILFFDSISICSNAFVESVLKLFDTGSMM